MWSNFTENSYQYWMVKALEKVQDEKVEVPVAALIVRDNEIISSAVNKVESKNDPTAHAEIIAIREASKELGNWRLTDCVLYTTLEPCSMCAGAIINSRISKIIFGAYDFNMGACGSKINLFNELGKQNQVEVIGGILEEECGRLLKSIFVSKR